MPLVHLAKRQWLDFPRTHRSRRNLLLHLVAVPAFVVANAGLVAALLLGMWTTAMLSLAVMAASLVWQSRGHRAEPERPDPFSGPTDMVTRIFVEQWVTFPRFVFYGGWMRAMRKSAQ